MKIRVTLAAAMLLLTACDDKGKEAPTPEANEAAKKMGVPSEKEIKKEISDGVKDVVANKGPKWKFTYKGDLKGEVEGGIMSAVSIATTTTVAGGAMTDDRKGKAEQEFTARVSQYDKEKPPTAIVSLTLADGTRCSDVSKADPKPSEIEVINADAKEYHAKLKGKLLCGDAKDKAITYEAVLQK